MKVKTISLTGPDGVGKSTAATLICELLAEFSIRAKAIGFADPLYKEVAKAFNVSEEVLRNQETKNTPTDELAFLNCNDPNFTLTVRNHFHGGTRENGICAEQLSLDAPRSPRHVLRWWATEYRRRQDPMYWVSLYSQEFSKLRAAGIVPVAQDLRDQLEADFTRKHSGQVWAIQSSVFGAHAPLEHSTQVTGDEFSPEVVIRNDSTDAHLRAQLYRHLYRSVLLHDHQ